MAILFFFFFFCRIYSGITIDVVGTAQMELKEAFNDDLEEHKSFVCATHRGQTKE